MRPSIIVLFLLLTFTLQSQIKPDFFPEDIITEGLGKKCYCKPGVANKSRSRGLSITYGLTNSGNYEAEGETPIFSNPTSSLDKLNQFEFKVKLPLIIKERTKLLLGYQYYTEFYNFNNIGTDFSETFRTLNNVTLKSNDYNLIFSHSLDEKRYIVMRYKYATNGNYSGWTSFESKYAIHSFLASYVTKKSEDFELGFGFFYTKNFRESLNIPIPFILYNRNFSPKWGIEAMFPANVFLRHNMGSESIAIIGAEYSSKSFRLDVDDTLTSNRLDYAYNHAELLVSANWERHLFSWFWTSLKFGYQFNFSSEFEAKSNLTPNFEADPGSGLFINFGLFISPNLNDHEHKSRKNRSKKRN